RVAALDAQNEAGPPGHRLVALHFHAGYPQVALEEIDAADLVTGFGRALVHARVSDQPLKDVRGLGGHVGRHGAHHASIRISSRSSSRSMLRSTSSSMAPRSRISRKASRCASI